MKILQELLLRDFSKIFSNLSDEILWKTSLDPRCRYLQKSASKQMLTENKYDESMLEIEQSPGLLQSPEDNSNIPQTSEVMILSYSK